MRLACLALFVPSLATAQRGGRGAAGADSVLPTDVSWRNIGPNASGRMVAIAGSGARASEYYIGTTGGGVWKTTDGGKTTVPVTDGYFGGSIGATRQAYDVYAVLDPRLQLQLARYRRVMDAGLSQVNAALKAAGQPVIVPSTTEAPVVRAESISAIRSPLAHLT